MQAMPQPDSLLDDQACYQALQTRDARFDGHFFTGVSSTGIYCRPVCKVRTPKAENCRFFKLAAQAERAGFRPCLRCRPELAPGSVGGSSGNAAVWSTQNASAILAQQAAALLDAQAQSSQGSSGMEAVAGKLGVSARHLRRIFETQWGVSPLQYLQTRRLLCAKQLLTDTQLPVIQVAGMCGFASLRRFNAAFVAHYRMQPRALRQASQQSPSSLGKASATGLRLHASYRPPYDVAALLGFLQLRALPGVEHINLQNQSYSRTLALDWQGQTLQGWVQAHFVPAQCQVEFGLSENLIPALPGIGPWTASYIAMRALRWPDAFPSGDVGIHAALGLRHAPQPAKQAEHMAQAWRPWRSYAVIRAWHLLSASKEATP